MGAAADPADRQAGGGVMQVVYTGQRVRIRPFRDFAELNSVHAEDYAIPDPFREGRTLAIDDCHRILEYYFDRQVPFSPDFLRPVNVRLILVRMLNNLRNIYTANHDWERLATVLQRLASVEPSNARHLHDLAGLLYRQGDVQMAHAQLSKSLQQQPNADGQFLTRERLAHLEAIIASLN